MVLKLFDIMFLKQVRFTVSERTRIVMVVDHDVHPTARRADSNANASQLVSIKGPRPRVTMRVHGIYVNLTCMIILYPSSTAAICYMAGHADDPS